MLVNYKLAKILNASIGDEFIYMKLVVPIKLKIIRIKAPDFIRTL